MSVKIRLARAGAKKRPYYRIVATDSHSARDGKFIEKLGSYNPMLADDNPQRVVLKTERVQYWLSVGALPTDRVAYFLAKAGLGAKPERKNPMKGRPKAKAQERLKAAEEAAAKAAEAGAAE